MNIDDRILACRLAFEARADGVFEAAWAGVQTLAQPFKFELDYLREPSGQWRDFCAATAYRPLDLPLHLLQDLNQTESNARDRVEQGLFMAGALQVSAVLVSELVLGAECYFNCEHTLLGHGLLVRAQWELAGAAANPDRVAAWSVAHWNEHGSAMRAHRSRRVQKTLPFERDELLQLGGRWAPLKTGVFTAATRAGRPDLVAALDPLLGEAAALFQLGRELGSINRDLSRGHCTYPVWRLATALGGQPAQDAAPDAGHALLAAMLTPTLRDLAQDALARHALLLRAVRKLGLVHVRQGLVSLAAPFEQLLGLYTTVQQPEAATHATFSISHRPQLQQVITATKAYLRADPAQHEAWEVYRCGFLNQDELVCRVFPLGLMLENRIAAGDDCGKEVDDLFELYARNRFHYFDTPTMQPPDTDTLGLMLRLTGHGSDPARCRELLDVPLGWLMKKIESDGGIPVFMTRGTGADEAGRCVHVVGRKCAAAQAGLLLGLLAFDAQRFRATLLNSGRRALQSFAHQGAAQVRFYDVPFGAGMVIALAHGLRQIDNGPDLAAAATAAEHRAVELLAAWRPQGHMNAQDAALLHLASRFPAAAALRDPAWLELLIRTQHSDGGWDSAPLWSGPGRGNVMHWYSSRLVTSALAYHALHAAPMPAAAKAAAHDERRSAPRAAHHATATADAQCA